MPIVIPKGCGIPLWTPLAFTLSWSRPHARERKLPGSFVSVQCGWLDGHPPPVFSPPYSLCVFYICREFVYIFFSSSIFTSSRIILLSRTRRVPIESEASFWKSSAYCRSNQYALITLPREEKKIFTLAQRNAGIKISDGRENSRGGGVLSRCLRVKRI